jgi:hypothetical protein
LASLYFFKFLEFSLSTNILHIFSIVMFIEIITKLFVKA